MSGLPSPALTRQLSQRESLLAEGRQQTAYKGYTFLSIIIERVFPMNLKKQLACIYTNNFFSGLRITDAVWVALLAARGFSLWEIGVAESVFHMVSLTFEVPSGMAADLLGRKKTLVAGGVCMVLSNLPMAFAPDLFFICLAMALSALANAMFSGTASALTYDSLKQCGRTDDYLRVSANCSRLSMLATAVGSLASTLERFLRFSGFYLLSAAFEGTAAAATALMTEPIVTEAQARREKQTFRDLPGQLARLVRDSITALRATPLAAKLIVSAAVLCIPSYLTKMFVQQRLVELGWPTALLFVPMLLSGFASMLGVEAARRLHPESLRRFYAVCALLCGGGRGPGGGAPPCPALCGGGCALVGAAPALGCIFGCMLVQGVIDAYLLHEDQKLNDVIPSDQRATLISVDGMVYSLLMIPASPLVGAVGDAFGQAGAGLAVLGVLVALTGAAALGRRAHAS